jgi:predicted acyltransferase
MNAIVSYAIATFLAKEGYLIRFGHGGRSVGIQEFIYSHWFAPLGPAKLTSLLFAVAFVLLNLAIMSFFWRKKIFVKI